MGKTQIHKIALNQLEEKGRKFLDYAQEHPIQFGLISITMVAGIAVITVPLALGFSSTGPVAGSIAASWQSSIGNVVADSFFALLQSFSMSGTFEAIGMSLLGAGALTAFVEWAKSMEWPALIAGWFHWIKSIVNPETIGWAKDQDRAVQEALKHAAWLGENVQAVDWARAGDNAVGGAGFVMNDVVRGAGWAAGEAAQRVEMFARAQGLL